MPDLPPPSRQNPGGFGSGRHTLDALESQRKVVLAGWQWAYGALLNRKHPYLEHHALRGGFFLDLPTPGGYWPGDHKGCLCEAVPRLRDSVTGRFVRAAT